MAAWRRKALELFPELRNDIQDPTNTIYMLFFDLLPMAREAHELDDHDRLRTLYGYAEWCLRQETEDQWNAAGVCFYEHLFDQERKFWGKVVEWLTPFEIAQCMCLWEARLNADDLATVKALIEKRDRKEMAHRRDEA